MKQKLIAFACVAIVPLAFAQTPVTDQSKTGDPGTATPTAQIVTVTAFIPGESIKVSSTSVVQPVTYKLSKEVSYVDTKGRTVDPSVIHPGTRVQIEAKGKGVERVTVVQPE
jgi:3D (Asp-Asp-Asp) domain-containing protein